MSARFDTYEAAYNFASTRANAPRGGSQGIMRAVEYGKVGYNVSCLPPAGKRFGWELQCEAVEPGAPILYGNSTGGGGGAT